MRVWILHVGEELPVDKNPRLFRYGHLAEELSARGHDVLRWAPTFQHFRKQHRFRDDRRVQVQPGYTIQFVHALGYTRNVSLARVRSYRLLGQRLRRLAAREPLPDIILTGIPSLEWCAAAVEYGRMHDVPVVLDVRDLWPDIYLQAVPARLRSMARWALTAQFRQAKRVCRQASAICGVSQSYLEWGLQLANRSAKPTDRVFPLGYQPPNITTDERETLVAELEARGVDRSKCICVFAGLLERCYDLHTVLAAAEQLEREHPGRFQFVICGDGSKARDLRRRAASIDNVLMLGWVNPATIAALTSLAQIGLAAYSPGAPQSLPNKPFEYMAGATAVVASLQGELAHLLSKHQCGVTYRAGDVRSLADAVTALAADSRRLQNMQTRGRELFESQFRIDRIRSEMADYLCEVQTTQPANRHVAAA